MTRPEAADDELREILREIHGRLGEVRRVLAEARAGNEEARVAEDLPEGHPLLEVHLELNALIAALAEERRRSARRREELEDALSSVEILRSALRERSTPIIEVWGGVLCLPVFGMVDVERSAEMTSALLRAISERAAAHVVIDVTAVDVMDTGTINHFISMVRAARLLGAECVLTGVHPEVAQVLVSMDVDLGPLTTRSNLRDALTRILAPRGPGQ